MAVVTISRDIGSGSMEVGRELESDPGYRLLDQEEILRKIKAAGYKWQRWAEEFDEHAPKLWEKYDWSYRGFTALVQSTILDESGAGNVTIMGRGANYLLQEVPFALRIRLVAPIEARVERLTRREKIDRESALWLIEKTDRERAGYLYTVYKRDGRDPLDYDMVLDSATMPISHIVRLIRAEIAGREGQRDELSVETLRMRALAAKIKAHLLISLPFFIPTIDVKYADGSVHIKGVVRLPRERDRVLQEARKLAGDAPLVSELRFRQ